MNDLTRRDKDTWAKVFVYRFASSEVIYAEKFIFHYTYPWEPQLMLFYVNRLGVCLELIAPSSPNQSRQLGACDCCSDMFSFCPLFLCILTPTA